MIQKKLFPLRQKIDDIDTQILALLNCRAQLAQEVGHVKAQTDAPVLRPEREAQVLRSVVDRNPGPLQSGDLQTIFREVMSACRALEKRLTVAYLGPAGTFSEQAMYQQFGHAINIFACASIDEVFRAAEAGIADFGVVPIENSSEGVINRTLDLLLQTTLRISGEVAIPIHHSLMTKDGTTDRVTRICAHSQALAQCNAWLNQHYPSIARLAVASNAEAARMASEDETVAGIAGELAAKTYGVQIVSAHIQDDPHNRTRFAVIGHLHTTPSGKDQTSLVLSVPNKVGAVYSLLSPLASHGVSMSHFESRPSRMGAWEYYFYVDIEGHEHDEKVAKVLAELEQNAAFFKLLGSYSLSL